MTVIITAKMSTTIALYGDTYVKNLRNYCNGDLRVPATVFWFDKGGLRADFKKRDGKRIDTDAKAKYDKMIELRPDVAFINVSGNDITTETKPREIFDRVVKIAEDLRDAGATTVLIAEIMTRGDFSKSPDPTLDKTTFDRKRQKINAFLAKHFKDNLIRFPDIKYPKDYSTDGVHLMTYSDSTNNTGMKKYESRIRRILCSL